MSTGIVNANGIELWYESIGDGDDPVLLLITGLGSQATGWPDEFCWGLVDRGFRVIRFDNRDSGLSQFVEEPVDLGAVAASFLAGEPIAAPYLVSDMAADTTGLLDALDIDAAHLLGASLGGMIAQSIAIDHPERARSLTSFMSSTGERELLLPADDVLELLLQPVGDSLEEVLAAAQRWAVAVGSPEHLDEAFVEDYVRRSYARSPRRDGVARQLSALVASPDRAEGLARLRVPTLVVHGNADRLIRPEAGRRTAELVTGAEFLELEGLGHDFPPSFWAPVIEHVTALVVRAAA